MKPQIVTKAIVLSRRDFQEADRILTVLTPEHGRISLIAKGVRRPKSKLAGGIELFTVNDITLLPSKSELKKLISSRMDRNFGNIVKDISKTMLGYELLKRLNRYMEDEAGPEYFELLQQSLNGLDDQDLSIERLEVWFTLQLLKITGHTPNLRTDAEELPFEQNSTYLFDVESFAFRQQDGGPFGANHIKLMRIAHSTDSPALLKQLADADSYVSEVLVLSKNLLQQNFGH